MNASPIGLFDSGVGGLTILRALQQQLPAERLIYLADSDYFPYGARSAEQLRARSERLVASLIAMHCKLVVIACNTATVAALAYLRGQFPLVPFVGVVPVVKVLAEQTRSGAIALLSTPGTASSPYLASLIQQFALHLRVINVGCEGLAERIERGNLGGADLQTLLIRYLAPVREAGADVVGLGCTHYPLIQQSIAAVLGPAVRIFDSSEPVARRVHMILREHDAQASDGQPPEYRMLTTGDPDQFAALAARIMGAPVASFACDHLPLLP